MGIFDFIGKTVTKVVDSPFGKAMDTFSAAFSNPLKTVKAITTPYTFKQLTAEHKKKTLVQQTFSTVLATGTYIGALYGGAAVGAAAKAGTLKAAVGAGIKTLIPKTIKGKAVTVLGGLAVAGAISREPVKTTSVILNAPGELMQFGGDIATFASKPSIDTAKTIIKESPIISAVVGAAGVAAVGFGGAAVVGSIIKAKATKEQTATLEKAILSQPQIEKPITSAPVVSSAVPVGIASSPILPETQKVTTTKRRRYKTKKKVPSVRQSVKVNIVNKPVNTGIRIKNQRYINERLLN